MDPEDLLTMVDERSERRLAQESSALRLEMTKEFAALRQEMTNGFAQLRHEIADAKVSVIKWSFLFWTGQFFTTAGFLLVLLRSR